MQVECLQVMLWRLPKTMSLCLILDHISNRYGELTRKEAALQMYFVFVQMRTCKYFYYLLSQQSFFDYMMSGSKGCKMPRGDKKQIMQWLFDLPSFEEQKRIASTLSSLDDKIEINCRINDNL